MSKSVINLSKANSIISYKGFNRLDTKRGQCRGHVFELNKEYAVPNAQEVATCNYGFHACKNPKDVLSFYHYCNGNMIYAKVKQYGTIHEDVNKVASSHIEVQEFLSVDQFKKIIGVDIKKERIAKKKAIAREKIRAEKLKIFTNNKLVVNVNHLGKTVLINMKKDAVITAQYILHVTSKEQATIIGRFKSINGVRGTKFVFTTGKIVTVGKDGIKANTRYELVKGKLIQKAA